MKRLYPYKEEGYQKPTFPHIANTSETEKYLAIESRAIDAIEKAMEGLQTLYKKHDFYQNKWKEACPEILAQMLMSYTHRASELAAIAYLERQGYVIRERTVDCPVDDVTTSKIIDKIINDPNYLENISEILFKYFEHNPKRLVEWDDWFKGLD